MSERYITSVNFNREHHRKCEMLIIGSDNANNYLLQLAGSESHSYKIVTSVNNLALVASKASY